MFRFLLVLCGCLIPLSAVAQQRTVALVDLTSLTEAQMDTLRDPYFQTFQGQVAAAGAHARVNEAKGALKAAERVTSAEEADRKAADAEMKAAKKNNDANRLAAAALVMNTAEADLKKAKTFEEWKKAEVQAAEAASDAADAVQKLRLAEFQFAMAAAANRVEGPAGPKYTLGVFQEEIAKAGKKVASRNSKTGSERAKAAQRKAAWEALSG